MLEYENLKTKLEEELNNVVAELSVIATQNKETGDWVAIPDTTDPYNADENLVADTTEAWNERRATLSQLEVRYNNIKRALNKFTTGDYGKCEISGETIELERLTANPAARTNLENMDREKELPL